MTTLPDLASLWTAPLYRTGDTVVQFNQLVIAILIILFGVILVRMLSGSLMQRIGRAGALSAQQAHVMRKLVAYLGYVIVILIALPFAGIPITIFAVLGGALAIGVGFGAQNLLNNLISGLILLMERPIRIGDVVELDNEKGRVEDIGNRCVRIRRFDGVHVLVPNSYFLEQRVVNWTLKSSDVRGTVSIGVAYGSAVEKVRELILQAANEQERIDHSQWPPEVLFEDFGDNSLLFTLYFWTHVNAPMDLRRLQSALRFRIDGLFAEAGIVIAFPQRDIHLDTSSPLDIRVLERPQ